MSGKYIRSGKRSCGSRTICLLLALVLVIGCTIGGTLAWLTAKTEDIANTFVAGQIGTLDLIETDTDAETSGDQHEYIVIPGADITKDPKVTYKPTNKNGTVPVDAYVFVQLTNIGEGKWVWNAADQQYEIKSGDEAVLSFKIADGEDGWTALDAANGVYYKTSTGTTGLTDDVIIEGNKIEVSHLITAKDVETVAKAADKLTFTAYAIQQSGFNAVMDAWNEVSGANQTATP